MAKTTEKDWKKAKPVRLSRLAVRDRVIVDGGFTCIPKWATRTVEEDWSKRRGETLFIRCTHGKHFLDGQCDYSRQHRDSDLLVGVRRFK